MTGRLEEARLTLARLVPGDAAFSRTAVNGLLADERFLDALVCAEPGLYRELRSDAAREARTGVSWGARTETPPGALSGAAPGEAPTVLVVLVVLVVARCAGGSPSRCSGCRPPARRRGATGPSTTGAWGPARLATSGRGIGCGRGGWRTRPRR
ncbi:hypothetical protein ACFQYP_10935 [Nonomuraea antimicrobica]